MKEVNAKKESAKALKNNFVGSNHNTILSRTLEVRLFFESFSTMHDAFQSSRRSVIKGLFLTGLAAQLPWLQSCTPSEQLQIPPNIQPLNTVEFKNLVHLLHILFPEDGNGPGAITVHTDHYILWLLNDKWLPETERNEFLQNLKNLNQVAQRNYGGHFYLLDQDEQENIVATLTKNPESERWLSITLTYIFEALLLDPKYGVNPNEIGWDWLNIHPGNPRPTQEQLYPTILTKKYEI